MVVSWFTSHPLPGPPSPSQPPRSHLIDSRGPLTPGALSRTPYSQEDGERLFPRPNCHFTYLAHSQNVSFPACKKDVLWWLVSKSLVAGGGLSSAHSGLSPASTFHSDQSTVSKQHPPCKKRRSGSLALSWHPPRIYWLGYKVKDRLTPTFLYRVLFNVPPNFQYQNEKTV